MPLTKVRPRLSRDEARQFILKAGHVLAKKPFKPHSVFTGGHAQTLAAFAWPRRFRYDSHTDEARLFDVASNTKVLGHCRWQSKRDEHPTMVIWHGIEGSSDSVYMLATAGKAFAAGFNVLRMNLRNCGGTEDLTPTLYHGGLTDDLRVVVEELIEKDGLQRIAVIGFSLGGNMVLKLAGEYDGDAPAEVSAVCAVSPSVDLAASAKLLDKRSNWLYHRDFLRRLKGRLTRKKKLYPGLYDTSELHLVRTLREFDDRFTSRAHGFEGADDYYHRASSIRVIDKIHIPTLIVHAQDDPFIPFTPLDDLAIAANPYILLLAPEKGGHVAFIGAETNGEDRFWAENRVVDFCRLADRAE